MISIICSLTKDSITDFLLFIPSIGVALHFLKYRTFDALAILLHSVMLC